MHDFLTAERVHHTIEQHLDIVTAALDGDLDAAERSLRVHVGESMAVVEQRAAMALARMIHGTRA